MVLCLTLKTVAAQSDLEDLSNADIVFSSIATGSKSIFSGENNGRLYLNPYNGVYSSNDFGQTWQRQGLEGRGVNKLIYKDKKLYAATYYVKNGTSGLFVSNDNGQTWTHSGGNYSLASVGVVGTNIYIGTYSHGLYVSKDNGTTWAQKIGDGLYGPNINLIETNANLAFATTSTNLYTSTDYGITWTTVSYFNNKTVTNINIYGNTILVGTNNNGGLFKSSDNGTTWKRINSWGNNSVGKMLNIGSVYYANRYNTVTHINELVVSTDFGETWQTAINTLPTDCYVIDNTYVYALNQFIFLVTTNNKLFRYNIPSKELLALPFLTIPWNSNNPRELSDKIYSYFDHALPLLGYSRYKEPSNMLNTTINFRGLENKEPYMYYSSHDGYDYSLKYGTPILAAADGIASYYYCKECGNTIKIDHQNGYQSTYMHLQSDGLITKTTPISVKAGMQIGLVGMTGNTTGPHLHFAVLRDNNNNGRFDDDIPDGRIDPYGWQNNKQKDPWENYAWTDTLGNHKGSTSYYLWKTLPDTYQKYINTDQDATISLTNMLLQIKKEPANNNFLIKILPSSLPIKLSNDKQYIANTSILVEAIDHFGQQLSEFGEGIKISYLLSELILENTAQETLQIHYYDTLENIWKPLETMIENGIATATTHHLSDFALIGTKSNALQPISTITIDGNVVKDWYTQYPTISFITTTPNTKVFYSYNKDEQWIEYTNPFTITTDGVFLLEYRAYNNDNIEPTQEILIKINTGRIMTKTIKVLNSRFSL